MTAIRAELKIAEFSKDNCNLSADGLRNGRTIVALPKVA